MSQLGMLKYLSGMTSRQQFLSVLASHRPLAFMNEQLPANARVLIIGAQMNYGLERPYYSDESWFATKWRRLLIRNESLEGISQDLRAQGITHVLYSPGLFIFAAQTGLEGTGGMSMMTSQKGAAARSPEYELLRNWSTFTLYKERFLEPIYANKDGYEVLKLK
jgi:hypothetical protein